MKHNANNLQCRCEPDWQAYNMLIAQGSPMSERIPAQYHDYNCPILEVSLDLRYVYELGDMIRNGDALRVLDALNEQFRPNSKDFLV